MPDPLCAFVGQGAALTAAAWAAAAANADGGGPFQRLGEGRGAALREAWSASSKALGGGRRRRAFASARPPTKRARREKGERRADQSGSVGDVWPEEGQYPAAGYAHAFEVPAAEGRPWAEYPRGVPAARRRGPAEG